MDQTPLVIDEIEAGNDFLSRLNTFEHVAAACWLRDAESVETYLYVAFDGLTEDRIDMVYGEVLRSAAEMKDHFIDPFRVKVIGAGDPVAKGVLDFYRRFPAAIPTRFNGSVFGGMAVAEAYVYPPLPRHS